MNKEQQFKERFLELLGENGCKLLESKHPNRIYVSGKFQYIPKIAWFCINYHNILSVLRTEYGYHDQKIIDLIKDALCERFNIKVALLTPHPK